MRLQGTTGHSRPEQLLQMTGGLFGFAASVWLVVWSVKPGGVAPPAAVAVGLAGMLIGLVFVLLARRKSAVRTPRHALRRMLSGYRESAMLYVAAKLGLPDLLAGGPRTGAELAEASGAHAPTLLRLLRGFVLLGICREESGGRFALGPLGGYLRTDASGSSRGAAIRIGEEESPAWTALVHSAMTGETAFEHAFGMTSWEHQEQNPELGAHFDASFRDGGKRATAAILEAYDFSPFGTIADIGGGQGGFLAGILTAHPSLSGILFDQPHVLAEADAFLADAGVADRCRTVGGNFLESAPAGADVQVLRSVIHDWRDELALTILRNCRDALSEGGKLLIIERLMPERAEDDPDAVWLDLEMLAMTGGRERTETELADLLTAAGLTFTRMIPTRSRFRIVEAVRPVAE